MSRIAYVNGRYLPHANAAVHVEDRGFQFADAVYEVCEVRDGDLIDPTLHFDRLERSLRELRIAMPMSRAALLVVFAEVARHVRIPLATGERLTTKAEFGTLLRAGGVKILQPALGRLGGALLQNSDRRGFTS